MGWQKSTSKSMESAFLRTPKKYEPVAGSDGEDDDDNKNELRMLRERVAALEQSNKALKKELDHAASQTTILYRPDKSPRQPRRRCSPPTSSSFPPSPRLSP